MGAITIPGVSPPGWPGGGIKGGISYGETDEFSYNVTKDPVHVRDLHATIFHQLGIDHNKLVFPYQAWIKNSPEWKMLTW